METDLILTSDFNEEQPLSAKQKTPSFTDLEQERQSGHEQTFHHSERNSVNASEYKLYTASPNMSTPEKREASVEGSQPYESPIKSSPVKSSPGKTFSPEKSSPLRSSPMKSASIHEEYSPLKENIDEEINPRDRADRALKRSSTVAGGFNSQEIKAPSSNTKGAAKTHEVLQRSGSILQRSYSIQKENAQDKVSLSESLYPTKSPIKSERLADAVLLKSQELTRKYSPSPIKYSPLTNFIKTDLKVSQELQKSQELIKKYRESPAKSPDVYKVSDLLRRSNTLGSSPLMRIPSQQGNSLIRLNTVAQDEVEKSPWDLAADAESINGSPLLRKQDSNIHEIFTNYMARSEVVLKQGVDDLKRSDTISHSTEGGGEMRIRHAVSFVIDPSPTKVDTHNRSRFSPTRKDGERKNYLFSQSLVQVSPPGFYTPKDDIKPSFTKENCPDGSYYKGEKLKDVKHGRGEFIYPDGSKYEGQWDHNQRSGYGIYKLPNGEVLYDGEWKDDVYHGNGTLFNPDAQEEENFDPKNFSTLSNHWWKYEGEFSNGHKQGLGSLVMVNNQKFVGKFKVDQVHGPGTYHRNDGRISGSWEFNELTQEL